MNSVDLVLIGEMNKV